jgi:hypothetical protein
MGVRFSPLLPKELVCLQANEFGGAMPGRSMVGRESLKLVMSVRFAPRQPDLFELKVRGVVKATVTSHLKKTA